MTIFDYMGEAEEKAAADIADMTDEEIISEIERLMSLTFNYNSHLEQYKSRHKGLKLSMSTSTYWGSDQRIILVGWDKKNEGGGMPAESVDEAVNYFRHALERHQGG